MSETKVISVVKASKAGVTVNANGERQVMGWDTLRAAAAQGDKNLAGVYSEILTEAKRHAGLEKNLTIKINNRTNTPHGYEAELYDVAGEFVSGRIVAVDFGQAGTHAQAMRDAESAATKLRSNGYTVAIER